MLTFFNERVWCGSSCKMILLVDAVLTSCVGWEESEPLCLFFTTRRIEHVADNYENITTNTCLHDDGLY